MGCKSQKIGLAGCGAMGLPMAEALLACGFDVSGFDVRPVEQFGRFSDHMIVSAAEFSKLCDIVICVVRDEAQILDLCFGEQAIFEQQDCPHTFVLSSTVSTRFVSKLSKMLPKGVRFVDAPMSGAPKAAIEANLTFMLGGAQDDITHLKPMFEAMGARIFHLGKLGAGMGCKVLNNYIAASSVVAVREVLVQAEKAGIARHRLMDVINASSGQTWFGSNFEQISWAGEKYDPTNTFGILEKDVKAYMDGLEGTPNPLHVAILQSLRHMPLDLDEDERNKTARGK